MRLFLSIIIIGCFAVARAALAGDAFTIVDAINQAVATHPGVGEAAANRRGTEAELRQTQGTLLPQVRLEARLGPERFNQQDVNPPPVGNGTWLPGRTGSIVIRQTLFDGFATLNEIWRQAARVDGAAYRVHERTELIALDAAEGYISVVRTTRLIAIAQDNLTAHRRLLANVEARYAGGRSGEGDLQQARERVAAAEAILAEFRQSLEDARAAFRRAVGLEPYNLRAPGRLRGLPASKDESLAVALRHNPTLRAAQADATAAKYGFHATAGAFVPNVSLEGRALRGVDSDTIFGYRSEASGKVVLSWDIFRGGQDSWRRVQAAEQYTEQSMRLARLQRDAFESLDKAWAARTITSDKAAALLRQVAADRKAIAAYSQEYELGQRSLIDLLNAQNQLLNALVSLESTRGVAVFADYQLLAAMGHLLDYLKAPRPLDAEPLESVPLGLFPTKIAPVLLQLPAGPEPLQVTQPLPLAAAARDSGLSGRWPSAAAATSGTPWDQWLLQHRLYAPVPSQAELAPASPQAAMSFAMGSPKAPVWPIGSGPLGAGMGR
jgi:outer membrane protein, adhesin transport system